MIRTYVAIDLKSFYASVECRERKLDPMDTNLVVADSSRTEKTICLAVSPSLKALKVSGRARLFEVIQRVREINGGRLNKIGGRQFDGESCFASELASNPNMKLKFIIATPQMAKYIKYSTEIYQIYLKYVVPEDIHVYSIDEVFIDVTHYLKIYNKTPKEMAMIMIKDVYNNTGITATAGIGTNLYLCKIAMDIVAKHVEADKNGVRIAELDEMKYRKLLWNHRPLTDFWRIGRGYAKKLEKAGLYTMGDIARCSIGGDKDFYNENLLYKLFGINAELLIDHAWGWEPCTIEDIKAYKPSANSVGSGQVLKFPYSNEKAKLIVKEMSDTLALSLVEKRLVTNQITLTVGYDRESLINPEIRSKYCGEITTDFYGREVPRPAHGTTNLEIRTSSAEIIKSASVILFESISDSSLLIRRINITANNVMDEMEAEKSIENTQLNFFTDFGEGKKVKEQKKEKLSQEKNVQNAMIEISRKFGKNAVIKGMNLEEGATTKERNSQIGGHKK